MTRFCGGGVFGPAAAPVGFGREAPPVGFGRDAVDG